VAGLEQQEQVVGLERSLLELEEGLTQQNRCLVQELCLAQAQPCTISVLDQKKIFFSCLQRRLPVVQEQQMPGLVWSCQQRMVWAERILFFDHCHRWWMLMALVGDQALRALVAMRRSQVPLALLQELLCCAQPRKAVALKSLASFQESQ